MVDVEVLRAEHLFEQLLVPWDRLEALHDRSMRSIGGLVRGHFNGVGHGAFGLVFKRVRSAIPELLRAVCPVDYGRRTAAPSLAVDPGRDGGTVRKGFFGRVAGSTRQSTVARDPLIEVEESSQLNFRGGIGIVIGPLHGRKPQRWFGGLVGRSLGPQGRQQQNQAQQGECCASTNRSRVTQSHAPNPRYSTPPASSVTAQGCSGGSRPFPDAPFVLRRYFFTDPCTY